MPCRPTLCNDLNQLQSTFKHLQDTIHKKIASVLHIHVSRLWEDCQFFLDKISPKE